MSMSPLEAKPTLSPFDKEHLTNEEILPSTSQDYKNPNGSPALARSVPSSHEATSPPEAANASSASSVTTFVYFTTEMANQASLDIERDREKYDTLVKWMMKKKEQMMLERRASPFSPNPHPIGGGGLGDGGPGSAGPTIGKDEVVDLDDISPTFMDANPQQHSANTPPLKRKSSENDENFEMKPLMKMPKIEPQEPENPLKRLEMMSEAQHFSNSNHINEVVEMGTKKDERAAKLEKLEDIKKCVEEEMKKTTGAPTPTYPSPGQFPPPGAYPYPGGPYPVPGGPFSAGPYPPPQGAPPPYSGGYGPYGYPMSAPPGKFGSPGVYPGGPPGPPRMHPAFMHHHHQMAMMQGSGAKSPKHSPAAAAAAAFHHHQMMMQHMQRQQSPYGYPGPQGPPHPAMMNPQNSMLMVARNGASPMDMPPMGGAGGPGAGGWAPQLTPCYPPSFPTTAPIPTPRVPSTPATPIK